MNKPLSHLAALAPAAVARSIEANIADYFSALTRFAGTSVHDDPDLLRIVSGVRSSTYNVVLRSRLDPAHADARIAEVVADFRARWLPFSWLLGPSSEPNELGARLEAARLIHAEDCPGMAVDLATLRDDPPAPVGLRVVPADNVDILARWAETFAACNGFSAVTAHIWRAVHTALGLGPDAPWRHYLGLLDDAPVATSLLHLGAGVAGVYQVAVLPNLRGRGIGSVLARAPLSTARTEGYRIGVLEATQMAVSVYRALGFREYCTLPIYVWAP